MICTSVWIRIILVTITRGLYGMYTQSLVQRVHNKGRKTNCVPLLQVRQNYSICLKYGMLLSQRCVEGLVALMQSQQQNVIIVPAVKKVPRRNLQNTIRTRLGNFWKQMHNLNCKLIPSNYASASITEDSLSFFYALFVWPSDCTTHKDLVIYIYCIVNRELYTLYYMCILPYFMMSPFDWVVITSQIKNYIPLEVFNKLNNSVKSIKLSL
jgi:hypothetical protein